MSETVSLSVNNIVEYVSLSVNNITEVVTLSANNVTEQITLSATNVTEVVTLSATEVIEQITLNVSNEVGPAGPGVAIGGTDGQILIKSGPFNYQTAWIDLNTVADPVGSALSAQNFAIQRANHTGTQSANTITGLATVATTGLYSDLINKPTLGTASTKDIEYFDLSGSATAAQNFAIQRANHTGTQSASTITGLATVATTGSYNDLINLPSIPAAQVNSDWNSVSGVSQILNKPVLGTASTKATEYFDLSGSAAAAQSFSIQRANHTGTQSASTITGLATVATSGSYNDLINKPTLGTASTKATEYFDLSGSAAAAQNFAIQRANHTGTQSASTITGLAPVATTGLYSSLSGTPVLATVATSGSYNDLTNLPSIPAAQVNSDWNSVSGVSQILNKPTLGTASTKATEYFDLSGSASAAQSFAIQRANHTGTQSVSTITGLATVATTGLYSSLSGTPVLATVATSGSYNDLSNTPTIPDAQVNADWNSESGVSRILNKPTFGTLAFQDGTFSGTSSGTNTGDQDLSGLAVKTGEGVNFIVVSVMADNAVANGTALRNAYAAAKLLTPNGGVLSATNRASVLIPPGIYNLVSTPLVLDTQYVDIIGITGNPEQVIITSIVDIANSGTLSQTANDVLISGITLENTQNTRARLSNSTDPAAYSPSSNLSSTKMYNVIMQASNLAWSMRFNGITYSGTFKNCTAQENSFSAWGTASGTFINCVAGARSFGGSGTASGVFTECYALIYSFGGGSGVASGTFTRCEGLDLTFAGYGTASGTFTNCKSKYGGFAGGGSGTASGTFIGCTATAASFGSDGTASGTFINCIGETNSWNSIITGSSCRLMFCRLTSGTFGSRTNGAKIIESFQGDTLVNDTDLVGTGLILNNSSQFVSGVPVSAGVLSVPVFTDHGNGTGTINSIEAHIYDSPTGTGILKKYTLASVTLSFVDGAEEHIVADYNSGSPILRKESVHSNINGLSIIPVLNIWRVGTTLHSRDEDAYGIALPNKTNTAIINTEPYRLSVNGGLVLSETATPSNRTVIVSSATVYAGIVAQDVLAFNSSVDLLTLASVTNGVWTYTNQTVYDNQNYNPLTGPAAIPSNKFANRYFYRSIGDIKQVFYVMGSGTYNSVIAAQTEGLPTVPIVIQGHCMLIGRITIQLNANSGVVEQAVAKYFTQSTVINHNDTANIQGGQAGEYYHLTSADISKLNSLTLGGNFTTSGAFNTTLSATDTTNLILPTTGTLATTSDLTPFVATNTWIGLTVGSVPSATATIPSGKVLTYFYGTSTRYRFIATDGSQDAYYTNFDGSNLTGLVATKKLTF